MVAGHALAADTAAHILRQGGNVVDAAVSGAAVLAVAMPHACSLGGDCFALMHLGGKTHGINGSGMSPAALPHEATPAQLAGGPLSCAAPGALGAWESMHRRFGAIPWPDMLAPAIGAARKGVPVAGELAGAMRAWLEPLSLDTGCRALFLRDGKPYAAGETFAQPALAGTLEAIAAEGAQALYRGRVGASLCAGLASAGGVLDVRDLAACQPDWVEPLEYVYRGHEVRVMPPNSCGLFMLLQLAALEGTASTDMPPGSARRLAHLIRAARASFEFGEAYVADPREVRDALQGALAPDTVSALRAALAAPSYRDASRLPRSHGTATISVADRDGNGVTLIQSVFMPFGSVTADAETGIVMNNRLLGFSHVPGHPNSAASSKRPAHTLNPVMVFRDGRVRLLMGTPGGSGQTLTLVQVLSNVVDHGMELGAAVSAPRWSMDLKGSLLLESEIGTGVAEELATLGLPAKIAPEQRSFFGSAECIHATAVSLTAVADLRRNAHAAAD